MKRTILWLLLPLMALMQSTTCTKNGKNPPRQLFMINPIDQYLTKEGDTLSITPQPVGMPAEIGYSFTVSEGGTIYEIGIRLPDTGYIYTVTLWDGVSQAVLAQENIKITSPTGFAYYDLTSVNAQVSISGNHTYVIGVYMVPTNYTPSQGGGEDFFTMQRSDQANFLPLTEGPVTFLYEYTASSNTPAFPANLSDYQNYIDGFIDIGFSYY
jgi:hypothetical protein